MRNVFITTIAALAFAGVAQAEDTAAPAAGPVISGEVSLDFAETANDKIGGTMNLDLGVDMGGLATVDLDFVGQDGSALDLDTWAVGTSVAGVGVAIGDDLGVMPGAEGEQTLAAPAMTESLKVTTGAVSVAVGLTDWTTDITDVSNVQGAFTFGDVISLTAAADYNMDSENTVLGAGVAGVDLGVASLGGAATYDMDAEVFAYEGSLGTNGLTAYLNGTDDNRLQNIGGEYTYNFAGAELTGGLNYNVDTEDMTPMASVGFAF